jgi:threonine aldolase
VHSGLISHPLPGDRGRIAPDQLRDVVRVSDDLQPPSIVVLEQTHRSAGGRVWPLDELAAVAETARELGVVVHIDGARLLNASVASGVAAAEYGAIGDTVTLCFSKGLGCPLGAILAGSRETMGKAWRGKFLFGGAMRQAGMVAAAAVHALDHHVDRLAEDHARARRLAEGLADAGLPVDPATVETNFVGLEVEPLGLTTEEATERIAKEGVLVGWLRPGVLRLATYLGVEDADVETAIASIPQALLVRV